MPYWNTLKRLPSRCINSQQEKFLRCSKTDEFGDNTRFSHFRLKEKKIFLSTLFRLFSSKNKEAKKRNVAQEITFRTYNWKIIFQHWTIVDKTSITPMFLISGFLLPTFMKLSPRTKVTNLNNRKTLLGESNSWSVQVCLQYADVNL